MFFQIFLAIFLGLSAPAHNTHHTNKAGATVTTQDAGDDDGGGGEEGHIPPSANLTASGRHC